MPLNATSSSFTRRRIRIKVKQAHFYFFLASYLFITISIQLLSHWIRDNYSSESISRYILMPQYFFLFYSKRGNRKSYCNENTVQYQSMSRASQINFRTDFQDVIHHCSPVTMFIHTCSNFARYFLSTTY